MTNFQTSRNLSRWMALIINRFSSSLISTSLASRLPEVKKVSSWNYPPNEHLRQIVDHLHFSRVSVHLRPLISSTFVWSSIWIRPKNKPEESRFVQMEITYLGFRVDADGIPLTDGCVQAMLYLRYCQLLTSTIDWKNFAYIYKSQFFKNILYFFCCFW